MARLPDLVYCGMESISLEQILHCTQSRDDSVWKLRDESNRQLSELDIYLGSTSSTKPCRHSGYNPRLSPVTDCGQKVIMSRRGIIM